jgi:COP9 signalosome complex subunit 5
MAARTAQQTWEANNKVEKVVDDEIYKLDTAAQQQILNQRPWKSDNKHFKDVRMSALALLKIQMHTGSEVKPGQVPLEVMGMLQGKIDGHTIIVTDSFALPIPAGMDRGATHVNPGQEAMEYMVQYTELIKDVGKRENVVGWYHSHPGYGCWMSGIDVSTQRTQQQFNDPFLAVVVDPVRSIGAGKVEIGAFRTFPEGYTTNSREASEWQSVPSDRVEDFGVHANCYYQLEMSFYKSSLDARLLDLQWRKYWVNTLAASPLTSNRDYITSQISDVAEKIEKAEGEMGHGRYAGLNLVPADKRKKEEESQLSKATRDTNKVTIEVLHGLSRQVLKAALFNAAPPRQ